MILTRLLSVYGDLQVAAFGVTQKFGTITMNISIGLTQGIMPLIGYNYAAKNFQRVKSVCRCSFLILFVFIATFFAVYQLFPTTLMRLFVSDQATVELGSKFLCRWSVCVPGMTFVFLFNSIFQAMGLWKRSLLLSILRQGVVFIPCLFIMEHIWGVYGLVWSQPLADWIALLLGIFLYAQVAGKLKEPNEA